MIGITTGHPGRSHEETAMRIRFIFLWFVVGIPLMWGVMKTLENALKLFE
jgi:hypothetical protein